MASFIGVAAGTHVDHFIVRPSLHRLVLSILVGVAAGCSRPSAQSPARADQLPPVPVRVTTVARESIPALLETAGTVRAVQRAAIAARIAGPIESLALTLGQPVHAGDVLLRIGVPDVAARADQTRAQLAQVERELARERRLLATGAGTADTVKALEDRLAQTRAALREAETLLDYATVRAPFDGIIARKHVEAGDFATVGTPLLQLDGRNAFEIEAGLPESPGITLAPGDMLEVEIPAARIHFRGAIAEFSSAADATARSITVKIAVPPGTAVRPGQFARVFVPATPSVALFVPTSAVSTFGQMTRVFTVGPENRALLRLVKTGAPRGDRIEILSGLDAAESVVVAPPATLREGQPLAIKP